MQRVLKRIFLVLAVLLCGLPIVAPPARAAGGEVFVLDVRGDTALVLLLPELQLAVRTRDQLQPLGLIAHAARFLPDGSLVAVDHSLALWQLDAQGAHRLLPAGGANAPLFVSPDGTRLAFLKPLDLPLGDETPLTNAVAVLDLATKTETVLFSVPGLTPRLYGWAGDRLLLEVPTWQPGSATTPARPADQLVLSTLATDAPNAPQALAALPALAPDSRYPQTSFDQRYLAYTSAAGAVVVDLAARTYAAYAGQSDPLWTDTGLTVLQSAARVSLAWAAADLAAAPALTGPAALPASSPEAALDYTGPAATSAVFLYRPVRASTRVSAYRDLDRTVGTIADWLGFVGNHWIYGRAYDQHDGTDYDGVTGDPVYAAAPGHVYKVVVDCANTYPNGPATFGSYIRINHGTQVDGAAYLTLVGHLQCTGYFIGEGADINFLPLQIAQMGNTGWSTGDHTHLQVYRNGTTIDPYSYHIISDTPPESSVGDLQGLVRDANGQPAPGVPLKLALSNTYRVGVSDGSGHYSFSNVPLGAATLTGVQGARWGQRLVQIIGGQTVTAPDLLLDKCGATLDGADACPVRTFDAAAFIADVTVPDTATWPLNLPLLKTWRLQNIGTTAWGPGYELVFVGGDPRGDPLAIPAPVVYPGGQVDLSTALTTPAEAGRRRGYWRLRSDEGVFFGPLIWVELNTTATAASDFAADDALSPAAAPTCAVAVLPPASPGPAVTVNWSGGGGVGALKYEVQYRDSGRGSWFLWLGATSATSGSFAGQLGHTYAFRCRATDSVSAVGSYPANGDTYTLLGDQAGQPDLHILNLEIEPNPAGGLWARLTVQNEGAADTQRGFLVDLYQDQLPAGIGDYTGSIYTWVNEPLAAGATRTLEAPITTGAGQGEATFYAQVDSAGVIVESDEADNIWGGGGVTQCLAAEDAYEGDNTPAAAPFISFGAGQSHTIGGPGDQDWAVASLSANHLYQAATSGLSAGLDTVLRVLGPDGMSVLLTNDDTGPANLASTLQFVPPSAGLYYFLVTDWNPATGGCSSNYTLTLTDLGSGYRVLLPQLTR